jgi:hypothetical protein
VSRRDPSSEVKQGGGNPILPIDRLFDVFMLIAKGSE